jgi:hypothetical protein
MDRAKVDGGSYPLQAICYRSCLFIPSRHATRTLLLIENLSSQPWLILSSDHYALTFHLIVVSTLLRVPNIINPERICPKSLAHLKNLRRKYSLISGPRNSCRKEGCLQVCKHHQQEASKLLLDCAWSRNFQNQDRGKNEA